MLKQGDIVQFNATTEGWGIIDWEISGADNEYVELIEHLVPKCAGDACKESDLACGQRSMTY